MFRSTNWRAHLMEMRRILESDRLFLMAGQIERLALQDRRRRQIEERLHEMPLAVAREETSRIEQIRQLAARNHRLLKAYLEGARRAAQRLSDLEKAQGRIGAYRRDGSRVAAAGAVSTKQVRA